jgi:putative ABC transport system permease protein
LLALLLGQVTVRMVTQTVNDLYFTTTVQSVGIAPESLLKGLLLGLLATMITAALPAWEAASVPPRAALLRSGLEARRAFGGLGCPGRLLLAPWVLAAVCHAIDQPVAGLYRHAAGGGRFCAAFFGSLVC